MLVSDADREKSYQSIILGLSHFSVDKKQVLNSFVFALIYGAAFYLLQLFLFQRGMVALMPDSNNLINGDAGWYKFVVDEGYVYKGGWGNAGFFPLFPLVWKLSGLSALGVSFLNIVFLAGGLAILSAVYKMADADRLLLLSTPSLYFCFAPYAEPLFILLGAALIYGIGRKKTAIVWVSLLLLALVRPTTIVLLPALLIMELLGAERSAWVKALLRWVMLYVLPVIISLGAFLCYQYYKTGVWFAYFKHQADLWGRKFSLPELPFNSSLGPKFLWLNALALFVGIVCVGMVLRTAYQWLAKNIVYADKGLILSILYIAGVAMVNIFFNPHWEGQTNVFGSHRYIFVSPFFFVFLYHFTREVSYRPAQFLWVFLLTNVFWLLFASYVHIMYLVYFNFCSALVLMYMLCANRKFQWVALILVAINIIVQVRSFQMFIDKIYTD